MSFKKEIGKIEDYLAKINDVDKLKYFIPKLQLTVLKSTEREYADEKLKEINKDIIRTPLAYSTDGQGDKAIVYLHYFSSGNDWYITERDNSDKQNQAFGYARLEGEYGELGYISINELVNRTNVELDLYWNPKTL